MHYPLITTTGSPAGEGLLELMAEYLSLQTMEPTLHVVLRTRGSSPEALQAGNQRRTGFLS